MKTQSRVFLWLELFEFGKKFFFSNSIRWNEWVSIYFVVIIIILMIDKIYWNLICKIPTKYFFKELKLLRFEINSQERNMVIQFFKNSKIPRRCTFSLRTCYQPHLQFGYVTSGGNWFFLGRIPYRYLKCATNRQTFLFLDLFLKITLKLL